MRSVLLVCIVTALWSSQAFALFGEELGPLLQLVSGQVTEIERLSETVGVAKDQMKLLQDLNTGIDRTISQIQSIEQIVQRAQGLDPTAVKSLSDLNDLLSRVKQTKRQVDDLMRTKLNLADQAITQSALQIDTSYKMGQEMLGTGALLARESQTASPGRATQITAASGSAQMLAQGIQLQTLAQMVQLQALTLEFHKAQLQRELDAEQARTALYEGALLSHGRSKR
jgi:hypothetical protein